MQTFFYAALNFPFYARLAGVILPYMPGFLENFFNSGGPLEGLLDSYEPRSVQAEMADAVAGALSSGRHLVTEAGTGVGKSLAYLVPCIEFAAREKKKVLVSTNTISLQEQLTEKDIPLAVEALSTDLLKDDFRVVLAKGRSNYLCLRRLSVTMNSSDGLFSSKKEVNALWELSDWAKNTHDGSRSDYPGSPDNRVWALVCSDSYHCPGKSCSFFEKCFYMRARRRLYTADLIVVNHALFFTHLKLEEEGGGFFPPIGAAVFDEAHTIEGVASEHLGINITRVGLERILNGLLNEKTGRGVMNAAGISGVDGTLKSARSQVREFFSFVEDWHDGHSEDSRIREKGLPSRELSGAFLELAGALKKSLDRISDTDLEADVEGYIKRCRDAGLSLDEFAEPSADNFVYWVEKNAYTTALRSAPVHVGELLQQMLWTRIKPVILTSATLAVGKRRSFDFIRGRLGLADADEQILGSTFDFKKQVTLFIEKSMPDPRDAAYPDALALKIRKYVEMSSGGAFVLFTSYRHQDRAFETLADYFEELGTPVFRQGGELSRTRMLEEFKMTSGSVLFGTSSFWQGVDVPGLALRNVMITRLPFSVPTTPLARARQEEMKKRGLNDFMNMALPEAVIRFKQGFGRLIRRGSDKGIVVVLDSRIVNKRYGGTFLESIPECTVKVVQ